MTLTSVAQKFALRPAQPNSNARGEVLSLRWVDLDLAGHRILLPQTKNNEGRIIYLNHSAEFRDLCYQSVATPKALEVAVGGSDRKKLASRTGVEPVLPP